MKWIPVPEKLPLHLQACLGGTQAAVGESQAWKSNSDLDPNVCLRILAPDFHQFQDLINSILFMP